MIFLFSLMNIWVIVELDPKDLREIISYVQKSYEPAITSGN